MQGTSVTLESFAYEEERREKAERECGPERDSQRSAYAIPVHEEAYVSERQGCNEPASREEPKASPCR